MIVADYLAYFLKEEGVQRIFGLPGGENVPLIEALRQAGIEYVLVHHEAVAGFAADVTGQLNGRPGVCMATVGPGAVNLLATAVSATLERSPVLAITGIVDHSLQHRVTHMQADLLGLFSTGTKGSFAVRPETAVSDIHTAWRLAQTEPRGAVHLGISPEVALGRLPGSPKSPRFKPLPAFDAAILQPVLAHIQKAKRPFLLAGMGIESAEAQAQLLTLVEKWQIPTAVTPKTKGHFPESHPLFAGCFTAYGDAPLRRALAASDLIIGAGLDGVDLVTSTWDIETPVVNLAAANADDPVFQPVATAEADLKLMLDHLANLTPPWEDSSERATAVRRAITQALDTGRQDIPGTILIHDLISALRSTIPPDGALTVDVGAFKLVLLQQWQTDVPKTLFVANGLSAMGYALPGALALKMAHPKRSVVAVVGDGALLMYVGELATIARVGLPIIILVVVDEALALIRLKQLRVEVPIYGTEFDQTDYKSLAKAFGLAYGRIDSSHQAARIFKEALNLGKPVLIEAQINKAEYDHFK